MSKINMKNILGRTLCCLLLLALLLPLAACDGEREETGKESISLTDALGRELTVEKNPERVAALLGSFADIWTLAGGELCASAEDGWEDFGLELKGAVNIGGAHSPSLELLISAEPTLVLASASSSSNVAMKDTLEAMGIPVIYFEVDSFEDYLAMLKVCTDLTGRADLYEKNGEALRGEIEEIKSAYKSADIPEAQRRVLLLRASSGSVKAKGSDGTVLGEMLRDMGCVNIADGESSLLEELSVEAVIREQPYRIFVVTMGSDVGAAEQSLYEMIEESPAWSGLEAIEEGRLYVMDKSLFNLKPNARFAQAYEKLYEALTEE